MNEKVRFFGLAFLLNLVLILGIQITANADPLAVDDINNTLINIPVDGNVLTNDVNLEDENLTVSNYPIVPPESGLVFFDPDGGYTYTPDTDFLGVDVFAYEVCNDEFPAACDTAYVIIIVEDFDPDGNPPVANNDIIVTINGQAVVINVSGNDYDIDGGIIFTSPITFTSNGTISLNLDGTFYYVPDDGFIGVDSFIYITCDIENNCTEAIVYITVLPDPNLPIAGNDYESTIVNTGINGNVLTNDADPNGGALVINTTPLIDPLNGTVTINPDGSYTYIPNDGFIGTDTFTYEVCDEDGNCTTATVTIVVGPDSGNGGNMPPFAADDEYTGINTLPIQGNVLLNDYDLEGGLTINTTPITLPTNGTVTINPDGSYTYIADSTFTGIDSFQYEVCDEQGACTIATVYINVFALPVLLGSNFPPYAGDDANGTVQNIPVSGNVTLNDFDLDNHYLVVNTQPLIPPSNGTLVLNPDGSYTYTPNEGYVGPDQFVYEICELNSVQQYCTEATVYILVMGLDLFPTAIDDDNNTFLDVPVTGNVLTNDINMPSNTTVNLLNQPLYGFIGLNQDGSYLYYPIPGFFFIGIDSFDYEICSVIDEIEYCSEATVYIIVSPEPEDYNSPPVANFDNNVTFAEVPVTGNLLNNDFDMDGDSISLNLTLSFEPSHGELELNPDGSYTYIPEIGFKGIDLFEYEICDNGSPILCTQAQVEILVLEDANGNLNDPPFAGDDANTIQENSMVSGNLLLNDFDVNGNTFECKTNVISPPANGTVNLHASGDYTYTPNNNYSGHDQFVYEICETNTNELYCAEATVYLLVYPRECLILQLYVWLEGPFNPTMQEMNTNLLQRELLPGMTFSDSLTIGQETPPGQPYATAPWNYIGQEGADFTNADYPNDVVDWVLVSLRTGLEKSDEVLQTAALVHKDGQLSFPNNCIEIPGEGPFYILIEHRNHMGVMSHEPIELSDEFILYDFRNQNSWQDELQTGFGQKEYPSDAWLMFAGDGDQITDVVSYDISGQDKVVWLNDNGSFTAYLNSDFDLNGDVSGSDKILWTNNNGISSRVPK